MAASGDTIRILHVDDEPEFTDLAATFLEREDDRFDLETAPSASAGLDRLAETAFDCVISDYDMPGRTGIEFLEAVRADHPELPFILFTGKGSEEVASDAISAGVTDYLQKGSDTDQYTVLANRVRNAVDRRAAERERKRPLEAIETAQDGISILDADGHYVYVNQRFADLHGYDPAEMVGEHWELAYPDADVPAVREEILPVVEREGSWHGETTSLRADGETVTVDHTLSLTDRGELICTVRDISDRKAREQELQRKTARLEALFEQSPDMINVHDTDGNLIEPNPQLCEATGYDAAELTDMTVWDLDRTLDPAAARALWTEMDVGDSRRVDGVYERRDGSTFPVEVHIRRLRLEGNDRFIAVARDVTDRRARQADLERYERIVQSLPVGVFRTTPDGTFVDMNDRYVSLLDADTPADLADASPSDFWADPAARDALLRDLDREGLVADRRIEVETLEGRSKVVEATLRLTEENGDRYLDGVVQDVTGRRDRRRRLEQTETMFENAQDALFLIDVGESFTVDRVNPAYEEATGLSQAALSGRTPREILGADQGAAVERQYRTCVEQRTTLEYEEELAIGDDRTHWETRITPVVIDDTVEKIVGATRNITDRKERERELRRAERRFEALFDDPNLLIGLIDTDGTVTDCNETAMGYIEADLDDVIGEPFWETPWWSDDVRPMVRERVEQAAAGEYVTYAADLTTPDGDPYSVEGVIRPVTDAADTVVSLVVSARDVTARTARERRLERYERIVETMNDIVFVVDDDRTVEFVNERITAYVDLSPAAIEGQPVMRLAEDYVPAAEEADRFETALERTFRRDTEAVSPERVELTLETGTDAPTFEYQFSPLVSDGTAVAAVVTMRDITERKRRERQLKRQNERFDELASAVSHDLQTPLATAYGRAELAVETGDTEQMEEVLTALDRVDDLCTNLVEVLRTREIVGETHPVDASAVARDAWQAVPTPAPASLHTDDVPRLRADADALRRLLENLLANATEHGDGDVTVRVGPLDDGFFVEDDGPGIPAAQHDEVFTPGYSTKRDGSGIGLASVRQIVMAHDWGIRVTEGSDGGARFEITGVEFAPD